MSAIYNSVFGATSNSPPPTLDKRNLSDTSITENSPIQTKQAKIEGSPLSTSSLAGQTKDIAKLFEDLHSRFNSLEEKLDSQQTSMHSKVDSFLQRISLLEEEASSRQIVVGDMQDRVDGLEKANEELASSNTELQNRVRALEEQDTRDPSYVPAGWEPSGSSQTKVVLMGDSNSSGKLKFWENKGTLGKALPGESVFCPTFAELKDPRCQNFTGATDVVVAVGTNNLRQENCNPSMLAKDMSQYIHSVIRQHPSVQVFLPRVLPICAENSSINTRINEYNHYIRDLCVAHPKLTFIDTNVFKSSQDSIKLNRAAGASDPLHLNAEGIKLYCSQFKFALRQRYGLPLGIRRRNTSPAAIGGATNPSSGSRRGSSGSRGGGRGTNRGGRST